MNTTAHWDSYSQAHWYCKRHTLAAIKRGYKKCLPVPFVLKYCKVICNVLFLLCSVHRITLLKTVFFVITCFPIAHSVYTFIAKKASFHP